jgi:hypothetical protein
MRYSLLKQLRSDKNRNKQTNKQQQSNCVLFSDTVNILHETESLLAMVFFQRVYSSMISYFTVFWLFFFLVVVGIVF